jgi:tRNA pseudouridine38-40 synthase
MRNLRLLLEYDGTEFHGFQKQARLRTVQGELEAALAETLKHPVKVIGAGRTDAGVHAVGQVVNFETDCRIPVARLPTALNSRLPAAIAVRDAAEVAADFDARRSARGREYRYLVLNREQPSALLSRYAWYVPKPLDVRPMARAARALVGEHDFAAFQGGGSPARNTVRQVFRAECRRLGPLVIVTLEANAFLYQMVRIVVRTLIEVGTGQLRPTVVAQWVRSGRRERAPAPAAPHGLYLTRVRYDHTS